MFNLSCGQIKYSGNLLVILSGNILLPFVDGKDLFDPSLIKYITLPLKTIHMNTFYKQRTFD